MNKEKSLMIAKIVLPILIIATIATIWFIKNKPNDNLDSAVQTTDITALNDDSVDKDDSVNTSGEVASNDAVTDSTNDVQDDSVIENSEAINKDSIQNIESTDNSTTNISEEANKTLNDKEEPANSEVSVTEAKLETPIETARNTEAPVSTKKPETPNADFALAASAIDLAKLKSYGLPIIIDFGADSCVPCKQMAPVLKKLNTDLQGKVIVKFVDVWKYKNAVGNFPVEVIPTQFFFDKNGNPYVPSDPDKMQMNMYSNKDSNEHIYTSHQGGMTEAQLMAVLGEMGVK